MSECKSPDDPKPCLWLMVVDGQVNIYEGDEPYLRKGYWVGGLVGTLGREVFQLLAPTIELPEEWEDPEPRPLPFPGRQIHPLVSP